MDGTDPDRALGQMIRLCAFAPNYRAFDVGRVVEALSVPIALGQYRIYAAADGRPLAFVTWALLDAEAEARHLSVACGGDAPLVPERDWRSGDRIWFVDFLAPFGHARQVCADLRRNVFPGRSARALRLDRTGAPKRLGAWRNASDPAPATAVGAPA